MSSSPVGAIQETAKLKPSVSERNCRWVTWHNHRQYLLPTVESLSRRVPTFHEDGTVTFSETICDAEVSYLLDRFAELLATVYTEPENHAQIVIETEDALQDFYRLARRLFLTNYDYTNEELAALLTTSPIQLNHMLNEMIRHLMGNWI